MEASDVISTDIKGFDKSKPYNMRAVLHSAFTSRAIGLVQGGWLPSMLAAIHSNATVLVDRNVVSEIDGRFDGGKVVGPDQDFLDLFVDWPVRINPLLFAIEGNTRRIPTPQLVRDQLAEAMAKLRVAWPSATLIGGDGHLRGALGVVHDTSRGMVRKQTFLMRVAPGLTAPVSSKNMQLRWNEVLTAADECGVYRGSLLVIAALSTAVVPMGASPARKLLKSRVGYSEEDAYNALCDLRSLEILMYGFALFPHEQIQLCTADRNLALFWAGIGASNFKRAGDGISFDLSPVEGLIPGSRLPELYSCIGAGGSEH